ncbi:MAG: alpha-amylase [Rhodospirillaceae bacterium]|nr:alpha-amylase [Rhodospirillaceae bacterium]
MIQAPRMYNLFPLLAGPVETWSAHLPRIADLGFDWIYLNPFHLPGFSGSLYAIKDFARLHPVLQGDSHKPAADLIAGFTWAAREHGLKVMADLVINHTAKDALLTQSAPHWYRRDEKGELYSPRAVDPDDPQNVTIWGDLAEIDYAKEELRTEQIAYWSALVQGYLDQGIAGFRCDAAYQVPAQVWRPLIEVARAAAPHAVFAAETLGCTVEQVEDLADAGFDYLFNSSKWWDFKAPWLLEQYEDFRHIAPSIAFPESHDTPRLVNDLGDGADLVEVERTYRLRYLFAAVFSSGVMMPIGYEYGAGDSLHVVKSRPEQWAGLERRPRFDLSSFLKAVNAVKARVPALNVEGPQRRVSAEDAAVVALLREGTEAAPGAVLSLVNPGTDGPESVDLAALDVPEGALDGLAEVTPGATDGPLDPAATLTVGSLQMRVFAR